MIIVLNLIVKPFYVFGIDLTVQNRLGPNEYGTYFSLYSLALLFNVILDMGINNYNTKNIAQNPQVLQKYLGKILSIRILLFLLYSTIVFVVGGFLGYDGLQFEMLVILVFNQFLASGIHFLRSNFGGLHLFKLDGILSVLDRVILIALASALLWSGWFDYRFDIKYFIYCQTISYLLTFLIGITMLFSKAKSIRVQLDKKITYTILKRSFPYALLIIIMMMYNRVDSVMLERISGASEAGNYAQSFRILDALNMIGFLFVGILYPMISRFLKEKGDYMELIDLSYRLLIPLAMLVGLIGYFHAEAILHFAYNEVSSNSKETFFYLMTSFVAISVVFVYGTLLTAKGNLRLLNIIALGGLVFNIVMNSILIPIKGAEGAAISTLCTEGIVGVSQMIAVHQLFNANRLNKSYFLSLIYLLCIATAYYFTMKLEMYWIGIIFLNIAISAMIYFSLGLINIKELKKIFIRND